MSADGIKRRAAAAKSWMLDAAFPLWASAGFDEQTGLFQEKLDLTGKPVAGPRRLRVQARQTYVFVEAGRLGWQGNRQPLVAAGVKTLCERARTPDGGVGFALDGSGALIEPRRDLYEQAFTLFALAQARSSDPARIDARIAEMFAYLETQRAPNGGFVELEPKPAPRWQNPHMHLFEAGMALAEAGIVRGETLAREMSVLFDRHFYDGANGALGEYYADDWSRAPGDLGRLAEPGHHCEWIWLVDRWRRLSGEDRSAPAAKLWTRAQRDGLYNGVTIDGIWRDAGAERRTARLWPQTEWLKAALVRFETGQGSEDDVCAAYDGLQLYFAGLREGLWRDRRNDDGSFIEEPAPASSFYHIVLAYSELLRVAAAL